MDTVLIIPRCFIIDQLLTNVHTESRSFLPLTPPHKRCAGSWEVAQPGQLTPADKWSAPVASCSAYTAGGRWKKETEWWRFSSQVTIMHNEALCFWRWMGTCLPMGSGELIPCFALIADTAVALLIKLSLHQFMGFVFHTFDSFPHPTRVREKATV